MRFGCCVSTREQIDILAQAGYDFCELPAAAVRPFDDDAIAQPALRALESAPLRAEAFNVLVPPVLPLVGSGYDPAALRAYLRRAFVRMARLGAEVVVLGSGGARRIPADLSREEGMAQLAASIAVVLDEASHAGITLALEHLNRHETNSFNSVAEAQQYITHAQANGQHGFLAQRGLRLLVDLHHLEMEQEVLTSVTAAASLIAHVHVADGGRRAPGVGGYHYGDFMRTLRATGYDKRISAECAWEDLGAQAAGALAYMRESWQAAIMVA
jgi:sugar phosphate isomerase/epimerase